MTLSTAGADERRATTMTSGQSRAGGRTTCTVCGGRVHGRGLCTKHYRRWRKHGDVHRVDVSIPPTNSRPVDVRLWEKVDVGHPLGCWEWTKCVSSRGYGQIMIQGKWQGAHRVAYELLIGPIPDGMQLDHLCRNRACVNPDHLEPVTSRENVLRGVGATARNAAKTRCLRGHALVGDNVYHPPAHPSYRYCRICMKARNTPI